MQAYSFLLAESPVLTPKQQNVNIYIGCNAFHQHFKVVK